jgi:hypothetical protein
MNRAKSLAEAERPRIAASPLSLVILAAKSSSPSQSKHEMAPRLRHRVHERKLIQHKEND